MFPAHCGKYTLAFSVGIQALCYLTLPAEAGVGTLRALPCHLPPSTTNPDRCGRPATPTYLCVLTDLKSRLVSGRASLSVILAILCSNSNLKIVTIAQSCIYNNRPQALGVFKYLRVFQMFSVSEVNYFPFGSPERAS